MMIKKTPARPRSIRFTCLLSPLLFCSVLFLSTSSIAGEDHHGHSSQKSFGPGDNYSHKMSVKLSDYRFVSDIHFPASKIPPSIHRSQPKTIKITLEATEVISTIAKDIKYHYWTFNNTVPGPLLRVRQGDSVELTLHNDKTSSHSHSIDLHAVTGPGGGAAVAEVEPGESRTFTFKAEHPGLYIYHCASGNAPTHIANGMYGLILVEPPQGLNNVDKEFYIVQGELYTHGKMGATGFQAFAPEKMIHEQPEYIVFNGRTGALTDKGALKANIGDKIRLYVGNAGVAKISSFHVIGEIFDAVYPEAATSPPLKNVQTTLIPAGGASMIEFTVDYPGNYVLVDHALTRVDRGAWGILSVSGNKDPRIFSGSTQTNKHHNDEH